MLEGIVEILLTIGVVAAIAGLFALSRAFPPVRTGRHRQGRFDCRYQPVSIGPDQATTQWPRGQCVVTPAGITLWAESPRSRARQIGSDLAVEGRADTPPAGRTVYLTRGGSILIAVSVPAGGPADEALRQRLP